MAGQIMMTPEQMHQYAQQYTNGSQTVNDLLNHLRSLQSQIEADWKGSGFDHFNDEFNQLTPKITQFAQLLNEISNKLTSSANAMQDTDQQIASQFN
ncbi:WXG100 family type VII secretion target [Ligilactobacillus aviarius]|uniref:WXG100 family type VII secretion target n=1 Tax=Ligilactobacillus aviarius TaxID=1606 RepID=UPI0024BAD971|nr:WXG100 family type VII secretion target [Ligilactobacillus aviarius]